MKEGADEEKACRGDRHHSPGFRNNQLFLNGGKPDWIDVCCTSLACLLGILFVLRLEKEKTRKEPDATNAGSFARDLPNCG
ncbi:hypothetical protein QNN00_04175 [Bacillus velezensis]|nr:hypothetical protein [Bacillus velezensis]